MAVKFTHVKFDMDNMNDLGWLLVLKRDSVEYVQFINELKCHWGELAGLPSTVYKELYEDYKVSYMLDGVIKTDHNKTYNGEQKSRWVQLCTHLR